MLFDIDGGSDDRGSPEPNRHDSLLPTSVMSKGTNSVNYTTQKTDLAAILAAKNGQFTIVQTGTYSVPAGTTLGIPSSPGAGNFQNLFTTFYSVPHNLNFVPGVLGFVTHPDGTTDIMPSVRYLVPTSTSAVWATYQIEVNPTSVFLELNLTVYQTGAIAGLPLTFKWYLFQQTSN